MLLGNFKIFFCCVFGIVLILCKDMFRDGCFILFFVFSCLMIGFIVLFGIVKLIFFIFFIEIFIELILIIWFLILIKVLLLLLGLIVVFVWIIFVF